MSMGEFDAGKMRSEIHEKMGLWRVCTSDVQTQHMHGHTRGAPVPGAAVSGAPAPGATEMVGQIWMEARRRREAKLMKLMHVKKYIQTHTHTHIVTVSVPIPVSASVSIPVSASVSLSGTVCLSAAHLSFSLPPVYMPASPSPPVKQAISQPARPTTQPANLER